MKTPENSSPATPRSPRLFFFTPREERLIRMACRLSEKFMQTYGKGVRPSFIDPTHYENCPSPCDEALTAPLDIRRHNLTFTSPVESPNFKTDLTI